MDLNIGLYPKSAEMKETTAPASPATEFTPQLKLVDAPSVDHEVEIIPEATVARDLRYVATIADNYRLVANEMREAVVKVAA